MLGRGRERPSWQGTSFPGSYGGCGEEEAEFPETHSVSFPFLQATAQVRTSDCLLSTALPTCPSFEGKAGDRNLQPSNPFCGQFLQYVHSFDAEMKTTGNTTSFPRGTVSSPTPAENPLSESCPASSASWPLQ
jgi:hypothetical protein